MIVLKTDSKPRLALAFRPAGTMVAVLCAAVALTVAVPLSACDTPVYRYAMYRWEPEPYRLFHLHRGGPAEERFLALREKAESLAAAEGPAANLVVLDVDVSDSSALDALPPAVGRAWQRHEQDEPASYDFLFSPVGELIHEGPIDVETLQRLVDSPLREEMYRQLDDGCSMLLVLLPGEDAEANRRAEELVQSIMGELDAEARTDRQALRLTAQVTDGIRQREAALNESDSEASPLADPTADIPSPFASIRSGQFRVGLVRVDRNDPAEAPLVRMLLATEPDLKTLSDPMVFALYGRGRVLPPCLGEGITRANLLRFVRFAVGACSCTVKEENPGVDLLISADWTTVARDMAERYGVEEGNENLTGRIDVFPEILMLPDGDRLDQPPPGETVPSQSPPVDAGTTLPGETWLPPDAAAPDAAASAPEADTVPGPPVAAGYREAGWVILLVVVILSITTYWMIRRASR